MSKEKVLKELNQIFCEVFEDETIKIDTGTTVDDIEDWDSLSHLELIVRIEQKYNIKFGVRNVYGLENVGQIVELILNNGKG